MRNLHAFEAWLFNHLALQMLYGVLDRIAGLTSMYSFDDLIAYTKGVRVNCIDNKWFLSKLTKKTQDLCAKLDLNLKLTGSL